MKSMKKVLVALVALCLIFGITANAEAATAYQDGSYSVSTEPDARGGYFKLNLNVSAGQITTIVFEWWNGANQMTEASIENQSDQIKELMQPAFDELNTYNAQLVSKKDVSTIAAVTAGSDMYAALQTCWKDFLSQSVVEKVEEAAASVEDKAEETSLNQDEAITNSTTTDLPKTGVISFGMLYGLGALGAITSGIYFFKRKEK